MKVKAKMIGYYGNARKRVGAVFVLSDEKHFSARWMEKLGESQPKKQKSEEKHSAKVERPSDEDVI